jgi:hypothetical protein
MPLQAPQVVFPVNYRRPRRGGRMAHYLPRLGAFGLVPELGPLGPQKRGGPVFAYNPNNPNTNPTAGGACTPGSAFVTAPGWSCVNGQWQLAQQPITALPTTPVTTPTTSTSVATSPVPSGYPTNQTYTDGSGNIWQYNATTGAWGIVGSVYAGGALTDVTPAATGSTVSVSTGSSVPTESDYQSILDWLSQSSLIPSVPNWVVALGAGLLLFKVSSGGKK